MTTAIFRWDGLYWGFLAGDVLFDRFGRQVGWLEQADVFDRAGRFLGEIVDGHYLLRNRLRALPVHRNPRPVVEYPTPPAPVPDRQPREPLDDWTDALPWPLPPPDPPRF